MSKVYKVYYLANKETKEIFYVGVTYKPLIQRYAQHIQEAKNGGTGAKCEYLRQINLCASIREIEQVLDNCGIDPFERERYWIVKYLKIGHPLTNSKQGWVYAYNEIPDDTSDDSGFYPENNTAIIDLSLWCLPATLAKEMGTSPQYISQLMKLNKIKKLELPQLDITLVKKSVAAN